VPTITNANTCLEIEAFAQIKEEFLKRYVELENGIPSHDTFQRVFEQLDAKAFNKTFIEWTNKLSYNSQGKIIAVAGKHLEDLLMGNKTLFI
jgi:hypothetical protein